jgi:lysophospholipase L1-like esterase
LITTHPHAAIVFVATISPNKENYAKQTQPHTSAEDRAKLAEERISYIKNHIAYAKSHNIPLINMYEKSVTETGDGNMKYINPTDDIHPSFVGVDFIGHEIANFIHDNNILVQ